MEEAEPESRGVTLLLRGITQYRAGELEAALQTLTEAEAHLAGVLARRLIARSERVVVLTRLERDSDALTLLDVVLFDLRPDTPGLDELAFALLALQVTLAERLQREEQVRAAADAFLARLAPGVSDNQRLCVAMTRLRRGRVAYVMGASDEARRDVDAAVEALTALEGADAAGARITQAWLSGNTAEVVVNRQRTRAVHRRIHWLIQQGDLDAITALTPGLVTELSEASDRATFVQLRDSLVDVYGALVAAERVADGVAVLDSLIAVLAAADEPLERGRATVLLAIKALLLRSAGHRAEADALTDAWKARVGPETWRAHRDMLESSCARNDVVRSQQRAGSLLLGAMMLDELDRLAEARAELAAFSDRFGAGERPAVAPFLAVADAARQALADGGRVADVMAGA